MSPAPAKRHQRCVERLYLLLTAACPPDLEVFLAPTDYQPTLRRSLQPDLLVVRRDDPGDHTVTTPLALAVEVLSPSSPSVDLVLKRELYAQSGVEAYWVVDPEAGSVTVSTLGARGYADGEVLTGAAAVRLERPFLVDLVPDDAYG